MVFGHLDKCLLGFRVESHTPVSLVIVISEHNFSKLKKFCVPFCYNTEL